MKKTKIVATIGPASDNVKTLKSMIYAGMNVARINFSHGNHKEHHERLKKIKQASQEAKQNVAILQDLGGVKIRIGDFEHGSIILKRNQKFVLTNKKIVGNEEKVYINYPGLAKEVELGQEILIADGTKKLMVSRINKTEVETKVLIGGLIHSRRGVNLPGAKLSGTALTTKDKQDVVAFGVKHQVDFIALSFIRRAKDVLELRQILNQEKSQIKIIAKIETPGAIKEMDKIIELADGIMVARGDLAIEMPAVDVPHLQKEIIKKSNLAGKPVIVATQMLESMVETPIPTRAEVADVTNAILDGTDAIMLSAETAIGKYPLRAVKTMTDIALRTEKNIKYQSVYYDQTDLILTPVNAISCSAVKLASDIGAKAIVALTESGFTARTISRHRPAQPILVLTPYEKTSLQLELSYGCKSIIAQEKFTTVAKAMLETKKLITRYKYLKSGDKIVVVAGVPFGVSGTTNMVIVETI